VHLFSLYSHSHKYLCLSLSLLIPRSTSSVITLIYYSLCLVGGWTCVLFSLFTSIYYVVFHVEFFVVVVVAVLLLLLHVLLQLPSPGYVSRNSINKHVRIDTLLTILPCAISCQISMLLCCIYSFFCMFQL